MGQRAAESHDGWELRLVGAAVATGTAVSVAMAGFFFLVLEAEGNIGMRSFSSMPVVGVAWPALGIPLTALAALGVWPGARGSVGVLGSASVAAAIAIAVLTPSLARVIDWQPAAGLGVIAVLAAAGRRWKLVAGFVAGAMVHVALTRLLLVMLDSSSTAFV